MPKNMQTQSVSRPATAICKSTHDTCLLGPPAPPPPGHRGREERREIGDEKERREHEGPKEIKVLWDHQENAGSEASWDLQGPKVT